MVLLKTKLYIPTVRSDCVERPRLFDCLDQGFKKRLVLISAPAGFGKTTLVSSWVKKREVPAAWLSLDKEDNDSRRFWHYFIAALQTMETSIGEKALALLRSSPPSQVETIITVLLNSIENDQTRFALVLDDFYLVEDRQIQENMLFLVDHMPSSMHLFLSTREDPPWPLARLRAQGDVIELRVEDLRFTLEETNDFLIKCLDFTLTPEDILSLDTRTEGWIVGLQMSALSMRRQEDKTEFIRNFTGSNRFILDYLVEEVFGQQSKELQEFLLKTSILDRMTASMCDHVLNRDDSASILKQLEEANLFLLPLDDERRWYRYHRLFADILRSNLKQETPEEVNELHHRASQWYARYGLLSEAANHAFMCGNIEYVAQLIEENALTVITILNEHLPALVAWLNDLPEGMEVSRPCLAVAHAWVLAYIGDLDAAEVVILKVEKAIHGLPVSTEPESSSREQMVGYLAAIRGYWFFMKGNILPAIEWMEKAILYLPKNDAPARVFSAIVLGAAIGMQGDLNHGIRILSDVASLYHDSTNPLLSIIILCELAGLQILNGRLSQVIVTCEEVLRLSKEYYRLMGLYPPNVGFAYARLSYALREQNYLEAAIYNAQQAVKIAESWGQKDSQCISYLYLALSLQSAGNLEDAALMIKKVRQITKELSPSIDAITATFEVKLHETSGDLAFVSQWSKSSGICIEEELSFSRTREYIAYVRSLMIQRKFDESLVIIDRLLALSVNAGAMLFEIEILILQAVVLHTQGKTNQAMVPFERALSLAEPEGYLRIFVDEGEKIRGLLHRARKHRISPGYISRLLAVLEPTLRPGEKEASEINSLQSDLVAALTRREKEILLLLITSLSIGEIAEKLCIETSTLRTHTRNIYDKLGVHSRMEAAAAVQKIDL